MVGKTPDFLDWFEEEMQIGDEEVAGMTTEQIQTKLEEYGVKVVTAEMAESLRLTALSKLPSGIEGKRLEYNEARDLWVWRDVVTGRFTTPPRGFKIHGGVL